MYRFTRSYIFAGITPKDNCMPIKFLCKNVVVSILALFAIQFTNAQIAFSDDAVSLGVDLTYGTSFYGGGVSFVDFDGDGWDDLFFAHPYGGHRLFRNSGGCKFEDVTDKAGLKDLFADHWAVGCTFVDYDGDGLLDLFVAGTGDRNLLLRNLGNGKFKDIAKELYLDRTGASVQMAFADYDRDGDLDGFLVTNRLSDKPSPREGMEVKGQVVGGQLTVEEKYREIFNLVRHPTEGVRVVKAGEYDLLYRNDGDRFREVGRELGITGTDEGLAAVWFEWV